MNSELDFSKYFEKMRVRIGVVDEVKREIDRLVAPDFNLFSLLRSDEVRLSNIIAELLDPFKSHGQGHKFLAAFLDTIEDPDASGVVENLRKKWIGSKNVKVEIEEATASIEASKRKMDILIAGENCGLMIENKPWASDQEDQLRAYREELGYRFGKEYLMVYLSGDGSAPSKNSICEGECGRGELVVIAYRPHLVDWLKRCLDLSEADRVRWVIKDFIAYIETKFPVSTRGTVENE